MSRGLIEAGRVGARVSRRSFLKAGMSLGAAAGGGLLLGFSMPAAGGEARRSVIGGDADEPARPGVFAPNAFVQIDRAGQVTLVMPKVEMGQGVYTALPMLIAEELEVPLSSVTLDHAPPNEKLFSDPLLGGQLTGGSTSVRYAWEPLRRAGATARTLLVSAAAKQWSVDPAACRAETAKCGTRRAAGAHRMASLRTPQRSCRCRRTSR
jgi:isoquinoline 1-oxidoreductase/isoquinoline 1-oxidoreductase beta subunit